MLLKWKRINKFLTNTGIFKSFSFKFKGFSVDFFCAGVEKNIQNFASCRLSGKNEFS